LKRLNPLNWRYLYLELIIRSDLWVLPQDRWNNDIWTKYTNKCNQLEDEFLRNGDNQVTYPQ